MSNLNQVLAFIKNADQSELSQIQNAYAIRKSEINFDVKSSFRVGDTVGINHKKVNPNTQFKVIKVMTKNIKVQGLNGGGLYTVTPSLLVKK